jgi:hypothetical protein
MNIVEMFALMGVLSCFFASEAWLFHKAIKEFLREREELEEDGEEPVEEPFMVLPTFPNKKSRRERSIDFLLGGRSHRGCDGSKDGENKSGPKTLFACETGATPWQRFRAWWNQIRR